MGGMTLEPVGAVITAAAGRPPAREFALGGFMDFHKKGITGSEIV